MENKSQPNKNKEKTNKILLGILITLLIIALGVGAYFVFFYGKENEKEKELAYTGLIKQISDGEIEKIEMTVGQTSIKVKQKNIEEEKEVIIPNTQAFIELVQEKVAEGNSIELIQNPENTFIKISQTAFSLLPTIMLVALFILVFKMQGLGEKGKVYDADTVKEKIKFDDVAGLDEEKQEMIEIVQFLKEPKKFNEMGAKIPKGVLLYGKPGTGKTLIAKAIAGEAEVPFISMSGSEFIEMFAGLGASRVRKLFEKARKVAPCIVFIDEIDAIGSRRSSGSGAESENNQTLNQLLVEMDGFDTEETIIVLAATNRPEMLDKALLRPGRFDRQITINVPDLKGREEILKIHSKDKKIDENITLKSIAEDTAGFTGAELANILNEAAILATINKREEIKQDDIEEALKKVTVGLQKTSRVISDKDKKLTAYHEAGHAIVSRYLETQEPVKEISIIPRGVAGGYTMYKTNEDKNYISKTEMEERLIALLGGRAAEKIALNDISTGASNDLEVATKIAKDMVTVYGMSDVVGTISINTEKDPYELQLLGEKYADAIGAEVKILLDNAYIKAQKLIIEHMDKLHEVAQTLLKQETINEKEFEKIFE
ncbi:MAG: ATP-dependent zinc metalloprotease FtsH [Clostridiaceae bacterium]|nr:ATP-dependent zinc metalloprotease FtsH [Clostridiaceae bacterium]